MSEQNTQDKRRKLIDDAVAQCQKTRKLLEQKMPGRFEQIRMVVKEASQEGKIRSGIAHLKNDGEEKAHVVETIQKYLNISEANPVFKQSVRVLLDRHKH